MVGKRLMMHPSPTSGLFDEDLESWQGQFGCSIESFEFYETDERRGFVRGAKWGLAPTFGPINAALPTRAGATNWGPNHHLHVRSHLGRGANWGLFGEDLPDEANQVRLSPTLTDSSGIAAPEIHYKVSDNSRRLLDFHIEKASESLREAGAHTIEVDRLMRYSGWHLLGTAGWATIRAPRSWIAGTAPTTSRTCTSPTARRRHVGRRQPHIHHLRARAAGRDHMVETRFDQQVPA